MADYRDPRNGKAVEAELEGVASACDLLAARLRRLGFLLEPDIELTPSQAQRLADLLGPVGILAGAILVNDVERTMSREDGRPPEVH